MFKNILINKKSDVPSLGFRGLISFFIGILVLVKFSYEFNNVSDLLIPVLGAGLIIFGVTSLAEATIKAREIY